MTTPHIQTSTINKARQTSWKTQMLILNQIQRHNFYGPKLTKANELITIKSQTFYSQHHNRKKKLFNIKFQLIYFHCGIYLNTGN